MEAIVAIGASFLILVVLLVLAMVLNQARGIGSEKASRLVQRIIFGLQLTVGGISELLCIGILLQELGDREDAIPYLLPLFPAIVIVAQYFFIFRPKASDAVR